MQRNAQGCRYIFSFNAFAICTSCNISTKRTLHHRHCISRKALIQGQAKLQAMIKFVAIMRCLPRRDWFIACLRKMDCTLQNRRWFVKAWRKGDDCSENQMKEEGSPWALDPGGRNEERGTHIDSDELVHHPMWCTQSRLQDLLAVFQVLWSNRSITLIDKNLRQRSIS